MLLKFTKMHGLGNDFMVLDKIRQDFNLSDAAIRSLGHRKTGIGFDQLLVVEPPSDPTCDFRYRIYNADGTEAEQCGNGSRCVARFVLDKELSFSRQLKLEMVQGRIETTVQENGSVRVDMGVPILDPGRIPFMADAQALTYPLEIPETGQTLEISAVSMGNPHAVLLVDSIRDVPVSELGPLLESHPRFPRKVNAGFMEVVDARNIRLRVFERGAGETLACGTGACAAVVAGHIRGLLEDSVTVALNGGTLSIDWKGGENPVFMTGPAISVFDGLIDL